MSLINYLSFVFFCSLLVFSPGPMTLLLMGLGVQRGFKGALPAQLGATIAYFIALLTFSIGLTAVLEENPFLLKCIQWIGVVYLLILAWKQWKKSRGCLSINTESQDGARDTKIQLFFRGFITGISNPKAFVIFGAIIPQFATNPKTKLADVVVLSATYLLIQVICGLTYIYLGWRTRAYLQNNPNEVYLQKGMAVILVLVASLIAVR